MKALLLGTLLGALVVFDPLVTAYLLRDFSILRDLPYLLSIAAALSVGLAFAVRAFAPNFAVTAIHDYWRFFPILWLLGYQFSVMKAGPLDSTEIVIGVFTLLFLAKLFMDRDQRFVSTPFNMLHLALVICMTISLASELRPIGYLKNFKPFVVFFLLVNFLPRENFIQSFLRWLVVFAMLSAAFGLIQEIVWVTTGTPLTPAKAKDIKMMFETHFGLPIFRPPAMMNGYRALAMYLATAMMLCAGGLLWRKEAPVLRPRWLILGLCLIVPATGLTLAKDVAIGCIAGLAILLIMRWPARLAPATMAAALAGALAILTVIAVVPGNVDTAVDVIHTIPKSETERIRLDRDSIEGFLHGPYFWTGRGVAAAARYTAHPRRWPAHNAFILAAAELGVAGLAIYLLIYGLAIARVVALNIVVTHGPYLPIARSLLAVMVVVLAGAQFEASYLGSFVWTIFAIVEAVWFQVRRQPVENTLPLPANSAG
jgi:hypothetical protein